MKTTLASDFQDFSPGVRGFLPLRMKFVLFALYVAAVVFGLLLAVQWSGAQSGRALVADKQGRVGGQEVQLLMLNRRMESVRTAADTIHLLDIWTLLNRPMQHFLMDVFTSLEPGVQAQSVTVSRAPHSRTYFLELDLIGDAEKVAAQMRRTVSGLAGKKYAEVAIEQRSSLSGGKLVCTLGYLPWSEAPAESAPEPDLKPGAAAPFQPVREAE